MYYVSLKIFVIWGSYRLDEEGQTRSWEGLGVGAELTGFQGERSPRMRKGPRDASFVFPNAASSQQKAEGEAGIMDSGSFSDACSGIQA